MIVLDIETNLAHDTIWCVAVKVDDTPTKILIASDYPLLGNPIKELQELIDTTTGHIVAHNSAFRIYLRKGKKGTRVAKLVDAPNLADGEAGFVVTTESIKDI